MSINKELTGVTTIYILLNLALGIFMFLKLICMHFNKGTHCKLSWCHRTVHFTLTGNIFWMICFEKFWKAPNDMINKSTLFYIHNSCIAHIVHRHLALSYLIVTHPTLISRLFHHWNQSWCEATSARMYLTGVRGDVLSYLTTSHPLVMIWRVSFLLELPYV